MARLTEGEAHVYYAPLIATDPTAATAIPRQPDVVSAHSMCDRISTAVVGIGRWQAGGTSLWTVVTEEQRDSISAKGVVAEICGGIALDARGNVVKCELSELAIGVSAEDLIRCHDVMALAFGVEKAEAILAATTGGIITSLVTHEAVARKLLSIA